MRLNVKRRYVFAGIAAALLAAVTAVGIAVATDSDDQPLTGDTYDRAVAAALAHTGGGEVTETEIGDDGAAYEVEVRLDDGTQVDVELDENFAVIGQALDDDTDNEADD